MAAAHTHTRANTRGDADGLRGNGQNGRLNMALT
jgi:hypothetical protein